MVNVAVAFSPVGGLWVFFVSRTSTVKVDVSLFLVGGPEMTPVA
jgi:hypothetical protein